MEIRMNRTETAEKNNRGLSLIELIIVIAIMAVLVGVLSPMFVKYVDSSRKAKDVYTADQIAKAVNVAFIEHPEAYDAFKDWKSNSSNIKRSVSVMEGGVQNTYNVYLVASSGTQGTNGVSNCFNGSTNEFRTEGGRVLEGNGKYGFYGVINRQLGLSTTEMNSEIIPKFNQRREGAGIDKNGTMVALPRLTVGES
ncbi:MAG: prepilin-type N-terminal cleavage/methylation domain-containing protein [Lachnospiraceae bacterium]|nr:prepilin-type N-terminal cleavage/methylation domain-containing protein [Lachnospiraceae bacterium]